MTDPTLTAAEQFKAAARPIFGTVSGSPATAYRIAVRNKTQFKQVAALAEQYGGTCELLPNGFPTLLIIKFSQQQTDSNTGE